MPALSDQLHLGPIRFLKSFEDLIHGGVTLNAPTSRDKREQYCQVNLNLLEIETVGISQLVRMLTVVKLRNRVFYETSDICVVIISSCC